MADQWTLENQRVLVTGASGYVGQHLAAHLAQRNEVFGLQRHPPPPEEQVPGVHYLAGDVSRLKAEDLPEDLDLIIHQAALLDNPIVGPEPPNTDLFKTNVYGTHLLLEAAVQIGVPKFVYGSTAGHYGLGPQPFQETDPLEPINFYHLTKLLSDEMCRWYSQFTDIMVLRYSAPYGPGTSNPLLQYLVEQVRTGGQITCTEDGAPILNPIYIDDAVVVTERACFLEGYQVLNIAGAEPVSQLELIERIGQALGRDPNVVIESGPTGQHLVVDVSRIQDLLEYEFQVNLDMGVAEMCVHLGH